MPKDRKPQFTLYIQVKNYSVDDYKAISQFMEDMAQQGWFVKLFVDEKMTNLPVYMQIIIEKFPGFKVPKKVDYPSKN